MALAWMALSLANWAAMSAQDLCSMMRSAVSLSPSACRAFPFKHRHLFYSELKVYQEQSLHTAQQP